MALFALLIWKKAVALARRGARAMVSWLRRPLGKPSVQGWGTAAVRFRWRSNDLSPAAGRR